MANSDGGGGYRKPPKHGQFVKGQSGNPKGRPRGSRGLKAELKTVLDERITHPETGKRLPRRQMIIRSLAARAVRGNVAAADKILALEISAFGFDDARQANPTLSDNDKLILEQFLGKSSSIASKLPLLEEPAPDVAPEPNHCGNTNDAANNEGQSNE